jgi:DNA-binding NarL/FixJ family response regulator
VSRPVLLTAQQADVLGALALCRTTARAARRLGLSAGHISEVSKDLRRKLGVETTEQIVPRARELGLLR